MSVSYLESSVQVPAGSRTAAIAPVPAGVANKDIVVVGVYKENTAAVTPPDGTWTQKAVDSTNATTQGALWVFWKRLTAGDTGTYAFTWTGSSYAGCHAIAMRGCIETGDPWYDSTILRTANNAGATVGASVNSISGGGAVSFVSSWATATRTWTAPSGWTKEEQTINEATGEKTGLSSGTTGTVTWTGNGNDYYQMFLGVLKPVPPPGTTVYVVKGGVKKAATLYVIKSGAKKAALPYVVDGGVKK